MTRFLNLQSAFLCPSFPQHKHVSGGRLLPLPFPLPVKPSPVPVLTMLGGCLSVNVVNFRFGKLSPSVLVCHTSYMSRICTNTHLSCESGFRSSGIIDLSSQRQCPLVEVTGHDRLWRDIFRPVSERLAKRSVLSASDGFQALAVHVVTTR